MTIVVCVKCGSIRPAWLGSYEIGESLIMDKLVIDHFRTAKCNKRINGKQCNGQLIPAEGTLVIQPDWSRAEQEEMTKCLKKSEKGFVDHMYG